MTMQRSKKRFSPESFGFVQIDSLGHHPASEDCYGSLTDKIISTRNTVICCLYYLCIGLLGTLQCSIGDQIQPMLIGLTCISYRLTLFCPLNWFDTASIYFSWGRYRDWKQTQLDVNFTVKFNCSIIQSGIAGMNEYHSVYLNSFKSRLCHSVNKLKRLNLRVSWFFLLLSRIGLSPVSSPPSILHSCHSSVCLQAESGDCTSPDLLTPELTTQVLEIAGDISGDTEMTRDTGVDFVSVFSPQQVKLMELKILIHALINLRNK